MTTSPPKPTVVVVGRPNVGKSTLVNRFLGGSTVAIVQEEPGVTRDFKIVDVEWCGRDFTLIDTGGWLATKDALAEKVSKKAEEAARRADLLLFVVDGETGMTEEDERVASWVRRHNAPVMLIVNKVDADAHELNVWDFAGLGMGEPYAFSALHGRHAGDVLDEVIKRLPDPDPDRDANINASTAHSVSRDATMPTIAIVGRPNVGKSTLFNRIVGEERSIVHDMPGTTRDTIDTVLETDEGPLRFVDTAGMRRKNRVDKGAEYYSFVRALQAIDTVDTVVFVIDATQGMTHQDQRLAERIDVSGKPILVVLNKWELLKTEERAAMRAAVEDDLGFVRYAPILPISAITGKGAHKLLPAIRDAMEAYTRRLPTSEVTQVILRAQQAHPASGATIYYAMQGAAEPPTFTLFANRTLRPHYLRYLERKLREHFDLGPSPIKIRVRRKSER